MLPHTTIISVPSVELSSMTGYFTHCQLSPTCIDAVFSPSGACQPSAQPLPLPANAAGRALTDAPRFLMSCRNGALTSSATGPTRIRLRCTHRWQSRRPGLSPLTRLGVEACIEPSDIDRRTCVPWNRWLQKTRRELSPSDPAPTPYAAGRLAVVCSSLCRA